MKYRVEPYKSPLYGGQIITIHMNEWNHGKNENLSESSFIKKNRIKTLNNNDCSIQSTVIETEDSPLANTSGSTNNTIPNIDDTNSGDIKTSVLKKNNELIDDSFALFDENSIQMDGISYFLVFEGSSVIHVVATNRKSKDTLVSIIPQHNKEETVKITIYKAYRNKKAQKFNEYFNKIEKMSIEIPFEYIDDGVSSISDEIIENLCDIQLCHQKLTQFIDNKLQTIGNSIDAQLNLENRLNYLLRFHVDVQYSLGFLVVLDSENLNLNQFNIEKENTLSYLKNKEFYILHKLLNKIYTLGSNYELDMKVEILPNEPSFLYFSSFDNKDTNFIREYTNKLVSHTTSVQNNFLSIDQKICIITNIFTCQPLTDDSRDSNDNITAIDTNSMKNSKDSSGHTTSTYIPIANKSHISVTTNPSTIYGHNYSKYTLSELNTNDTTNNLNKLAGDKTTNNSKSVKEGLHNSSMHDNLNSGDNSTGNDDQFLLKSSFVKKNCKKNSNSKDNRSYVTIKSSYATTTTNKDTDIQVDKTTIQKFFSTKCTKAEANATHERYRTKVKSLAFDDSYHDEYSGQSIHSSNDRMGGNTSCKSNSFLREFLLKSCSTSSNSHDTKETNSKLSQEIHTTSHSFTCINKPYLQITTDSKPTIDESNDSMNVNCKSDILCNSTLHEKSDTNNLVSSSSNITSYVNKKPQFKTHHNKVNQKLSSNKLRHSTFGHCDKLSPTNHMDRDDTTIREFLDKEIIHLDNDTSFKNNVAFKANQKSKKISLGFGLFKKDKVYSDISNVTRGSKSKIKSKTNTSHQTSQSPDSKPARLTSLKKFNTSSDIAFNSQDNFNRSINCLFANNDIDLNTDANNSILFDVDTWSSIVDPKILKKIGPRETKRQDVIYELIYTENQYLRTLKTLYQVMYKGLQSCVLISTTTVDKLMPNLTSLIAINGRFLADLVAKQNADENYIVHSISDIFQNQFSGSVGEYMAEIYAQVCLQKHSAVELYKELLKNNKEFNYFVTACANRPQLKRLTIPECIAFVTQRPLKYPILIQEILKNTKEDSSEYEGLTKALANARNVIKKMNTLVAEYENTAILDKIRKKIDPKIECTYKGSTFKIDEILPKSTKLIESHAVVFRTKQRSYDIILVALWTHLVLLIEKDSKYVLLSSENPPIIPMQNLLLRTVATDKKAFFLVDKFLANMYEIVCANVIEKSAWVEKINKHLKENVKDFTFTFDKSPVSS